MRLTPGLRLIRAYVYHYHFYISIVADVRQTFVAFEFEFEGMLI